MRVVRVGGFRAPLASISSIGGAKREEEIIPIEGKEGRRERVRGVREGRGEKE
jgi:hypothetical protein